jgi:DHA2 family multidrug resistance protein
LSAEIAELFARFGPRYKWLATLTAMLGTLSMVLASTIVNVAVPAIMRDFDIGQAQAQWLATAFLASMTVGMLANAWSVKAFGIRATYMGAMLVFMIASVLGGLAPSLEWMILARVLQGLMAGAIQPLALIVIFEVFPPYERGRGMGVYGMGVILGPAIGPVLGGVLVDLFSWRAVFFIALPTCLLGLYLAHRFLRGRLPRDRRPALDVLGLVLLPIWLTALLWALANGQLRGWGDPLVQAALLGGTLALAAFIAWELRCRQPLFELRMFLSSGFTGGFLLTVAIGAGLFGSTYLLPLFVQEIQGFSATAAGLLLMPAGLAMAFLFPVAGYYTDRMPPGRLIVWGTAAFALSSALLTLAEPSTGFWLLAGWIVLGRLGLGLMMPPTTTGTLGLLAADQVPQGSGLINFGRQFGGAFGVNLLSVALERRADVHAAPAVSELQAYTQAFHDTFMLLVLVFVLALLPLYLLHRADTRQRQEALAQ